MTLFMSSTDMAELVGVAGFFLYVANYGMLTLRFLSGHSVTYFALNLVAASFVLIGLTASFNLASALIQVFWVAMSLVGIALHMRRTSKTTASPDAA
jgi:hypothetical protein